MKVPHTLNYHRTLNYLLDTYNRCVYNGYIMKTVLHVKVDPATKIAAQKVARDLGVPLSIVVNTKLKDFVRTKELHIEPSYRMKPKLERFLAKVEKDIAEGKNMSPAFDNADDFINYLNRRIKKKK